MKKIVTGYADDVAAMAEWPSQNQKVINAMEEWLEWSETMDGSKTAEMSSNGDRGRSRKRPTSHNSWYIYEIDCK